MSITKFKWLKFMSKQIDKSDFIPARIYDLNKNQEFE